MSAPVKIVVLGGGYAGTMAANHLRTRPDLRITVVNPRPEFVERIRLHQLAAGSGTATLAYDTLLGEGIELVVGEAVRIDAAHRRVELTSGDVEYDYLVYAVGSAGAAPDAAVSLSELEGAQKIAARLAELPSDAPVVVVGGGLTGVETAAELAEQGRRVTLVTGGTLAPYASDRGRRMIARTLARLGVAVRDAQVTEVRPDEVRTGGTTIPAALTIWTAGFDVPQLARTSGLSTDDAGRLRVDDTLTSVDDDRIVAAGDAADTPLRMSCQAAIPLGVQAANTVLSRIAGTEPAAVDQGFTGACVSLGRRVGAIQLARRDDTPVEIVIGGRLAGLIKEQVCRGTVWGLRREARKPGSAVWLRGRRR
jgi:NADH dehydrogenase